jgi:hypothetical protein
MSSESSSQPKRPKRSGAGLTTSSEVLQALFEGGSSNLSDQFLRWRLWKNWAQYVGKTTAAISEPVGYKRGVLYIWVKNSSWMQQMIFMLDPLKENINLKMQKHFVKSIQLTLDRKSVPADAQSQNELKEAIAKTWVEID